MSAYYNENDPKTAAWLRELIKAGLIADGEVDTRSIVDVAAADLAGFEQCHFFAGIGGWSYAMRLAGWPDRRRVWTGSCPCQPWSSSGRGDGPNDSRDLWPAWFRLIAQCGPFAVFGEQVASSDGLAWLDRVCADLEGADYAIGAADLCAASVGAPHGRQRLWFVADASQERHQWERLPVQQRQEAHDLAEVVRSGAARQLANSQRIGLEAASDHNRRRGTTPSGGSADRDRDAGANGDFWRDADWLECRDGRRRPVEPGTFPLAHGIPARVGRLRGYGNAIVPQVAAAFIEAYLSIGE